jgi:hypothetical protein
MQSEILSAFGLDAGRYQIEGFGTGLINHTWKVIGGEKNYVLQRINQQVFKQPRQIADNITGISSYLSKNYPGYLFIAPEKLPDGESILHYTDGEYYRLTRFVEDSVCLTTVNTADEAYEAAKQFGRFAALLNDFNSENLSYTLPDFHNLSLRCDQLRPATQSATAERLAKAANNSLLVEKYEYINDTYQKIIVKGKIPLRVMHHDTKISNVLFDKDRKGLCVIDLDTIMPGYITSDLGDMMRTYLSPAGEEDQQLEKVCVRPEIFEAIVEGYLSEMGSVLTPLEKGMIVFSGEMMIYMQAIRFLEDYLNNDIYCGSAYPDHNLVRAENQFTLLKNYVALEKEFKGIVDKF